VELNVGVEGAEGRDRFKEGRFVRGFKERENNERLGGGEEAVKGFKKAKTTGSGTKENN